jgi:hypothetical protein
VRKYPTPKDAKEVRSLGLASFYRRLVPKFAEIAKPLTELLRKDAHFKWEGRQQAAFEKLKEVLCSEQVWTCPDFRKQFILSTDAPGVGVAAILSQVQDGIERPICFSNCQMNKAEQNYSGLRQKCWRDLRDEILQVLSLWEKIQNSDITQAGNVCINLQTTAG